MKRNVFRQRPAFPRIDRTHPLASGLVFAGLGGGASTLLYADASGYNNSGVLTNMEPATDWVWDSTLGRWVLTCDGSDDYASIPHNTLLGIGQDAAAAFTVCAWVRQGATNRSYEAYVQKGTNTSSSAVDMLLGSDGTSAMWGTGSSSDSKAWLVATSAITAGTWVHLCGTLLATNTTTGGKVLYVNGVSKASGDYTAKAIANTSALEVGRGGFPALADIADPCIWRRALSISEIQKLADPSNVMLSGLILPPKRRVWAAVTGEVPAQSPVPIIYQQMAG